MEENSIKSIYNYINEINNNSYMNGFHFVSLFSITMWIHVNHGDEGLIKFLETAASLSIYNNNDNDNNDNNNNTFKDNTNDRVNTISYSSLLIEPQPWKCYKSASKSNEIYLLYKYIYSCNIIICILNSFIISLYLLNIIIININIIIIFIIIIIIIIITIIIFIISGCRKKGLKELSYKHSILIKDVDREIYNLFKAYSCQCLGIEVWGRSLLLFNSNRKIDNNIDSNDDVSGKKRDILNIN
jgi:hypothetical protein